MKKLLLAILIFIVFWLIVIMATFAFMRSVAHAEEYTLPRCHYNATNISYVPTRLQKTTTGVSCYVNISGKVRSMGIPQVYEAPTGIYNSGFMMYENDVIYYPPTNQTFILTNDMNTVYSSEWCLIDTVKPDTCYSLMNEYGKSILANGIVQ